MDSACPAEEEWARLAAGLLSGERADWLLNHASECDACAHVLQLAVECISSELDSDDEKALQSLQSSTPIWQRRIIVTAAQAGRKGSGIRSIGMAKLAWAAALLIGIAGAVWWVMRPQPAGVAALLSKAYSEHRPFEVRIANADSAPLRVERGAKASSFSRPAALLEAESLIQEEEASHPNQVEWMHMRGRAEMLDLRPSSAVDSLERALQVKPADPDILADLGCALSLRASAEGRTEDYSRAIEALNHSLQLRPDAPYVLFNLALAYQHLRLFNLAIETWNRYLKLDPTSGWAVEARGRLAELKEKRE